MGKLCAVSNRNLLEVLTLWTEYAHIVANTKPIDCWSVVILNSSIPHFRHQARHSSYQWFFKGKGLESELNKPAAFVKIML